MRSFLFLIALLLASTLTAQSSPNLSATSCGYQRNTTNDSPSSETWQRQAIMSVTPVATTYNGGGYLYGSYRGSQLQWQTVVLDISLLWDGVSWSSLPYVPIFALDLFNFSSPPTPWTVPGSVSGADQFFLSSNASITTIPQWVVGNPWGSLYWPVFYMTLDVPNDPSLAGIEMQSQWARSASGGLVWTSPWVVRIV